MKEKQALTREVRQRYQKASRKAKQVILEEFLNDTGYNRKYALRKLNEKPPKEIVTTAGGKGVKLVAEKKRKKRQGKKTYGEDVIASLRLIWAFFWNKCGKILAPLMRQQMEYIAEWAAFGITPEIRDKLMKISPATIDRALKQDKADLKVKGKSLTKSANSLKSRFPIRTFYTKEERNTPGYIQTDTVHHCGATTKDEYLLTLSATDVYSGWIELRGLQNKAWRWTFDALADVRSSLPFPFLEYHSDNGSEFINDAVAKWCENEHVPFTRSRDHKKNDNCFAEQTNNKAVREYIGYDRMTTQAELAAVNEVYMHLNPFLDYFLPTMKLVSKVKCGSRETKKYDQPKSPYQRLLESPAISEDVKAELKRRYAAYNPVVLQNSINNAILKMREIIDFRLAEQAARRAGKN